MDVSIFLEKKKIYMALDTNGNEVQIELDRKAPSNKPIFVDSQYEAMPMVYVNDEVFENNQEVMLKQIAEYIQTLKEVDTISIASVFFKEPVISALQEVRKKGITINGDYILTNEDYKKFEDVEVINVQKCEENLLKKANICLTSLVGYKGNSVFHSDEQIRNAKKTEYLKIESPLSLELKHDLELFFKWNTDLKRLDLLNMTPTAYLKIIEYLKPYLDKIPQIRLGMNIKDSAVQEMSQIVKMLGEHSEKAVVQYETHLEKVEQIKSNCSLKDYIVMDEILTSYKMAIEAHGYSPLEKLIYAYDIVKNVDYKELIDDKPKTRNLHDVILGGEIVCVGYSNLLNGLLTKLGIPATESSVSVYRSPEKEEGHQRSVIYLKDSKYGIDGLFICDPTWDAKSTKDIGYDRPIDRYNYFLLPYDEMKYSQWPENVNALSALSLKQSYLETIKYYSLYQHQLIQMNELLGLIDTTKLINEESEEFKKIDYGEREELKRNTFYAHIQEQIPKFKQIIPFETIARAIETVRRTEGVYQSEVELKRAIAKIIELHNQVKPLIFSDTEMKIYIEQNGKNQVLVAPVQKTQKEKTA